MDKKFGYYIFGGMLLGAIFGIVWATEGNLILGLGTGALTGAFIGWFAAAAAIEIGKEK